MKIENKVGKNFDSLNQRILYAYIATYPECKLVDNGVIEESQIQMHDFIESVLFLLYKSPEILGVAEEPDACYENWALNNSNPALIKSMEKIEYKFANFVEMLIKVGQLGEIEDNKLIIQKGKWSITKATKTKLELLGMCCEQSKEQSFLWHEKFPKLFPAWKAYSKSDDCNDTKISRVIAFIHGRYGKRKYRAIDFFGKLIGNSDLLEELENYFEQNNFKYTNFDINNKTRYAYVKWLKEYSKNETAYMKVYFNWRKKDQLMFEFRLPQFRIMLHSYDQMDVELQKFVFSRLKTCDNCGYCTQTDKSGKRACLAIDLSCDGELQRKCPLYPSLTWVSINDNDMTQLRRLFEFAEAKIECNG